ncbi:hypothetical protein J0S82_008317, partial [Galemys pyrenaicus]
GGHAQVGAPELDTGLNGRRHEDARTDQYQQYQQADSTNEQHDQVVGLTYRHQCPRGAGQVTRALPAGQEAVCGEESSPLAQHEPPSGLCIFSGHQLPVFVVCLGRRTPQCSSCGGVSAFRTKYPEILVWVVLIFGRMQEVCFLVLHSYLYLIIELFSL